MGNSMKKNKKAASSVPENEVPQEPSRPQNGQVVRRRKKAKKGKKERTQKGLSCPPDIGGQSAVTNGGATPYTPGNEEAPRVKVKLYRSYADLEKFMQEKQKQSKPDLKVYRRSTGSLERVPRKSRTKSLPRNYELDYSRDSGNESAGGGSFLNGTAMNDSGTPGSEYSSHPQWSMRPNSINQNGPTTTSTPVGHKDPSHRSCGSSNSQSIPSVPESPMSNFEFPTSPEVKRKLELFEDIFRRSLLFKYQSLDEDLQLSKVCVAQTGLHGHQEVSISQYLDPSCGLPFDLIRNYYRLTIPTSSYRELQYLKTQGNRDENLWRAVAIDIVDSVGLEVGRELSRMYEYQIISLAEDVSIQLLAAHATDCIMEYITKKKVMLERNTAVKGVVNVRPPISEELNTVFSVLIGSREYKWELYDIFKKPGLRKEVENIDIYSNSNTDDTMMLSEQSPYPWSFFLSPVDCDPYKYGYRGQMLEWDYAGNVYSLATEENEMYSEAKMLATTDIHQHYVPYSHLVTTQTMHKYLDHLRRVPGSIGPSFVDFVRQDKRYVDRDGEELLIYRPLSLLGRNIIWSKAVLENMDLTRLQMQNEESFCYSLRNSRLLLSNITHAHLNPRRVSTDGCDLSYSTWVCYSSGAGSQTKATMVCLEDVEDVDRSKNPGESMIIDKDGRTVRVEDDIRRRETQLEGGQAPPPPDVLVDYNYNVAERRSIHVLKTLQEDQAEGGNNSRASSVSGPATVRRRKKRRKTGSLASDSSGHSSGVVDNSSLDRSTASATATTGQKYLRVNQEQLKPRPKSATLVRERSDMDAQQQLMQPRTPPLAGVYRPQSKYHKRVMSSNQADLDNNIIPTNQQQQNYTAAPNTYHSTDGRVHTYPLLHQARPESRNTTVEGQMIPLDPIKDALTDVEECPGAVYFKNLTLKGSRKLFGRQDELARVNSLMANGNHVLTITGCPGLGKSAFVLAVAYSLRDYGFLPIMVDTRGCNSLSRVHGRLMNQLGLRLPLKHVAMLKSWLGSCEQKILLVIDNLELPETEEEKMAEFLHELQEADNVYILVTSRKKLMHPGFTPVHSLNNISGASALALLRHQVPDLPDDVMEMLVIMSEQVPYALCLIAQGLRSGLMDTVEILNALQRDLRSFDDPLQEKFRLSEEDFEITQKMLSIVKTSLCYIPNSVKELLCELTVFDNPVLLTTAKAILRDSELVNTLSSLINEAPAFCIIEYDPVRQTVFVPDAVRHSLENGPSSATFQKCSDYCLNILKSECKRYHSKEAYVALKTIAKDYDVVYDTMMDIALREDMYNDIKQIGSQEMCMFLNNVLEFNEFTQLYENLSRQAQEMLDSSTECCVQCCLAYHQYDSGDYSNALVAAEEAARLQADCTATGIQIPNDFCSICLGKIYWRTAEDDKELRDTGLNLVKGAVDSLKNTLGLQNILTIYAYEDYVVMEKEREHYQKARYLYNILDFVADERLGLHPDRIRGYNSRREIWERQGLFVRAAEVAKRAAEASLKYYGEHLITANMYSHWCECLVKAGDAAEANRACAISLGIREKLLGIHKDTALSNKMYAYLMLRGGHYDHSLMYGQRALDISQKLSTKQKLLKDLELILKHAYKRQQAMQAGGYIRIETQKRKKYRL